MASETSSSSYAVHLGFWINWSHGPVEGVTLTLGKQNGGFLIAALAISVGMVGKSLWRLLCFILHRNLSTAMPQDGLYHQRQAILRNSDTAQDGAWRLLTSMLAWRSGKRASRPILRMLPLIIAAFLLSAAFGLASIFSSHVTTDTANQVLLKGTDCGILSQAKANNPSAALELLQPHYAQQASQFLNYGIQCYNNASSLNNGACGTYIKPQLPLITATDAACPFNETMCKLKYGNLIIDTGRLDSLEDLGVNSAPEDRFQIRFVHHCAPLVTEGFTETFNDSRFGPVMRYMYGPNFSHDFMSGRNETRWTYEIPINYTYRSQDGTGSTGTSRPEYSLGYTNMYAGAEGTPGIPLKYLPIQELNRADADIALMFMSAPGIAFSTPVDDPLFSAHIPGPRLVDAHSNTTLPSYQADEPTGVLGCTTQMQYCNPSLRESERCEPLRGTVDPAKDDALPKLLKDSQSRFEQVLWVDDVIISGFFGIHEFVGYIGTAALKARYGLSYGYQSPLPTNQWQIEVAHWVKGALASLQDVFVATANGPPKELRIFLSPPDNNQTSAQNVCKNQKIVSTQFSSFNVLGILLILLVGGVIIFLDVTLEPAFAWWQKRRFKKHMEKGEPYSGQHPLYATLEWSATSTLQLQRLAQEEAGYGKWQRCDSDNPVTLSEQKLATLNVHDVDHPILQTDWRAWGVKRSETGLTSVMTPVEEGETKDG